MSCYCLPDGEHPTQPPTPSPPQFHTPMHCSSIWFITQTWWRFYSDCNSFKTSEKTPQKTSLRFPESLWWNYNVHSYYIGSNRQFETKKESINFVINITFFCKPAKWKLRLFPVALILILTVWSRPFSKTLSIFKLFDWRNFSANWQKKNIHDIKALDLII